MATPKPLTGAKLAHALTAGFAAEIRRYISTNGGARQAPTFIAKIPIAHIQPLLINDKK